MTPAILTTLITTIAAFITGVATWMVGKKKRAIELEEKKTQLRLKTAEIEKMKTDSSKRIMNQYQDALDDLQKRYEMRFDYLKKEYNIRHQDLKADYERRYKRFEEERESEIQELKKEIDKLRRNLELWKTKYRNLKKELK